MPHFYYHALDVNGQPVTGDLEATGVPEAVSALHDRGLSVQSISLATATRAAAPREHDASQTTGSQLEADGESLERAVLRSHMATILERGRAISPALRAYAEEMPRGWQRRQVLDVCSILERGNPSEAAAALAELPECWISLLSAATTSHEPGHILSEFLAESQRTDDLRQKWWLTLAYPLILAALAIGIMTVLSIFVIPGFRSIFAEFNLELPSATKFVLSTASFLSGWGWIVLVVLAVLLLLLSLTARRLLPAARLTRFADRLRLPFGRRIAVARFARFIADLLDAEVGIPDALRIAGFTVNQPRMQRAAWQLANDLESTGGFSQSRYQQALTASVAYALAPEIRTASRVPLLREISNCHAERARAGLSWTTGLVEPIAICLVGVVVGFTVLGLFMPLIKLIEGLSN